jgi:hypothetical protein
MNIEQQIEETNKAIAAHEGTTVETSVVEPAVTQDDATEDDAPKGESFTLDMPTAGVSAGRHKFEGEDERIQRMADFMTTNAPIVSFGKNFFSATHAAKILSDAGLLLASPLVVGGHSFPLADGEQHITNAGDSTWLCPACGSAHGTGLHPSPKVSAKGIMSNSMFWSPVLNRLFSISDTCWREYVSKPGLAKHVVHVARYVADAKKPARKPKGGK